MDNVRSDLNEVNNIASKPQFSNFASLELVMGQNSNFGQATNLLVSILRNLMLSRRFKDAAEFNHHNLNAFIIKNMEAVRTLGDSIEDLISKSLIREKELYARFLDALAHSELFTSPDKIKNSKISS